MKMITVFAAVLMFVLPMLSTCSGQSSEETTADTTTIDVRFVDSAPDMFILENGTACDLDEMLFFVDFSNTAGQLYFDTVPSGDGSMMSAPFSAVYGQLDLIENSVHDGDESLMVRIVELGAGEQAIFAIDVDDAAPRDQFGMYRVSAAELSGGVVGVVTADDSLHRAVFEDSTHTVLSLNCNQ